MPQRSDASSFAHLLMRSHFAGQVMLDDRLAPLAYVRHPRRGTLIAPIERWMIDACDATLLIPDSTRASLQLHVQMSRVEPRGEPACDRWLAYHTGSSQRAWCELTILSAKLPPQACPTLGNTGLDPGEEAAFIIDADDLLLPNEFADMEPRLCAFANTRRDVLSRVCSAAARREFSDARCVGVDQDGIDLRTMFGPQRLDLRTSPPPRFEIDGEAWPDVGVGPDIVQFIGMLLDRA